MEKKDLAKYFIIELIFIGLVVFLIVFQGKLTGLTGYAVYTKTDLGNIERGSYWNKIDNGDGSYSLEIYNTIINYNNGTEYVPISYGSCGSYCFRDWNGLIYRVSNDSKKAYINLYDINDNYISSFGFGITGTISGNNYKYSTLNFTWTWTQEYITETDEYIFRAYNNNPNFNWTQEFHFYPNQSMKIKNIIRNNLGVNIQNAKFWYIQTVGEDDGIWFNGTRHAIDTYKTGEFDSLLLQVKFEDYYIFEYDDLLENGFNITDFYLGSGSVVGVNGVRILAIGITKGNSVFPTGVSVTVDPTIKLTGSLGGVDAYVRGDKPTTNYGSDSVLLVAWSSSDSSKRNSYLTFNISSIPENQKIDNATLCLYLYKDEASQNISAHHVYTDWQENVITWNNQPCGTGFGNSSACNLTAESNLSNNGNQDNTWQCWDIKNMVGKEYKNSSKKVSIALYTIDIGNADEFYSKEYSNSSLWPYLNLTYSLKDIIAPNLTIISPGNLNYNNATILVNISAEDPNLNTIWWFNGSENLTYTSEVYYAFQEGSNSLVAYANDSIGNENSSSVSFFVDSITPVVDITSPQDGANYGYNNSIALDYSANDINLENCWYNTDNENNISLVNCQNTTFNISEGSHTLRVYANDSLRNTGNSLVSFNVQVGAPTIEINSPIDVYLNYHDVTFSYTPTDIDLQACELWGDFNGNFELNQTNLAPNNGIENSFSLYLEDGSYLWNIKCNDTLGNSAFNGNKTFYVDTISPSLSLNEPSGTKTSRIITASWSVSDLNLQNCWYNVYRGASLEIANTSVECSLNSTSFNVTVDASFIFNFYVNDSAGNQNSASSSFTVSTSQPPSPLTGGGGGGGGGGSIVNVSAGKGKLELSKISNLIVNPGENRKMVLSVKNIGSKFLNDCKIKGKGENAAWISSEGLKGLSVGEKKDFIFTLKIPEGLKAGSYNLEVGLICQEHNESTSFTAEIIEKKLGVELIKTARENKDKVKIVYALSELSGTGQEVEVEIVLFGEGDERLAEIKESRYVEANSRKEFEAILNVAESLEGNFNLLINGVSQISSTFVQEEIVLGSLRVGGFAIFGGTTGDTMFSIILAALFIIFIIFILRRIFKFRKLKKHIDFKNK